jgi:hypothetical protein
MDEECIHSIDDFFKAYPLASIGTYEVDTLFFMV